MATSSTLNGSTSYTDQYTQGGSNTHSEYGSTSNTHSHSSTTSESKTHSEGGSKSVTAGESASKSASKGGSKSVSTGESWASGKVSDRTQQKFNQATQDYVRSQKVEDAYANLQNAINARPTFQSKYEDKLTDMYNRIMNREPFSYDFNKDAMYQQYKDMYQTQGRRAMQDTMGQLSAMNSGYGSSYAQTAGQQTYQNYLQQLNDRIPELRQQALNEYDRENDRLMQQYGLTNDAYNREYGQYRDATSDWQADRSFNQSAYQDERNFDYNQAQNDRNFWQNEYWQERNAAHSNTNVSEGTNWNEGTSYSQNRSQTASENWSDSLTRGRSETDTDSTTETSGWQNSSTNSWSHTTGTTNTTGWSNTNSSGSGSGGSGGGSGNNVQFSNENSMHGVFSGESRQQIVDDVSALARQANTSGSKSDENALGKYLQNLYKNGSTGTNGEHVQYSVNDLTNIYNRAITMDVISNGSRNGAQTLSIDEMRRKLGIGVK